MEMEEFKLLKGKFVIRPEEVKGKLSQIKAFISDWDGVFNTGVKSKGTPSLFAEADSMGTNLLRFSTWNKSNKQMPYFAIITGANNPAALNFAQREHAHAVYSRTFDKSKALEHFCRTYHLSPHEVAFFFDDANDLIIAKDCGVRCLVRREASPLFTDFVRKNQFCDYITASESGGFAVREICEVLMALQDNHSNTLRERATLSNTYKTYFEERQSIETSFFEEKDGQMESVSF